MPNVMSKQSVNRVGEPLQSSFHFAAALQRYIGLNRRQLQGRLQPGYSRSLPTSLLRSSVRVYDHALLLGRFVYC